MTVLSKSEMLSQAKAKYRSLIMGEAREDFSGQAAELAEYIRNLERSGPSRGPMRVIF